MKNIKNNIDLIDRVHENFNKDIIILNGNYINQKSIFTVKCNSCKFIRTTTARGLVNFDCPGCKGISKKTNKDFEKEFLEKTNNEYILLSEYYSGSNKILIKHKKCGHIYEVIAKNLVRTNNPVKCPFCSNNCKFTLEKFKEKYFNKIENCKKFKIISKSSDFNNGMKSNIVLQCKKCNFIFERKADSFRKIKNIRCNNCQPFSLGINQIQNFLIKNNIIFYNEVYFKSFKSKNGNYYKYDIFIPNLNLLIEYDGLQHFQESNLRFNENVRKRDILKNIKIKNCKKYSLLRISFKENDNIEKILKDVIIDKSSTTIQKYNLLYIKNGKIFNYNEYYASRSTFKRMEMGDINQNILIDEDIVSTSTEM